MVAPTESHGFPVDKITGSEQQPQPPEIFIVYESHEEEFVRALKNLLDSWGFDAFYCRQEIRELATAEPYRKELAERLSKADLVILVLSNGFQYSAYCQAEAGATVTYKKHQIQILVPPVTYGNVYRVSPVLEGWEVIDGSKPKEFVTELWHKLVGEFGKRRLPQERDSQTALKHKRALEAALDEVIEAYRIEPPSRALIGVWDSLTDERTSKSIIAHLGRAVAEGETHLAVVGVSLKYSINIISEAIDAWAEPETGNVPTPGSHASKPPKGPLTIELVHMDDQSHILHSLQDSIDIESVIDYFRDGWLQIKADWESKCKDAGVMVNVTDPIAIDYIPQQVGIRIKSVAGEWSVLYAGRCSFRRAGVGTHLSVGEDEYFFYTSPARDTRDDRGPKAIGVFNQYFKQYRSPKHNGATLVLDHFQWIARLENCVSKYRDVHELVIVSNTTQKLFPLIVPALSRGFLVRVYTCHPDLLSAREAEVVKSLKERLVEETRSRLRGNYSGRAELRYFYHTPTFRAALIGEAVLGLQAYLIQANAQTAVAPNRSEDSRKETNQSVVPSELRLIATRHSEHFQKLRKMVDLQCGKADATPYAEVPSL